MATIQPCGEVVSRLAHNQKIAGANPATATKSERQVMVKFVAKVPESTQPKSNGPCLDFIMLMLHARTTAHLKHWMTPSRSDHQALQFFYDSIVPLIDDFVESYQGEYGKIANPIGSYTFPTDTPLDYVSMLCMETDRLRVADGFSKLSWVQNQVDSIRQLLSQTRYQLAELK